MTNTVKRFVRDPIELKDALRYAHINMIHGALGLTTEVYEYASGTSRKNRREELGDACFYLNLVYFGTLDLAEGTFGTVEATLFLDAVHTRVFRESLEGANPLEARMESGNVMFRLAIGIQDVVKTIAMYCSGSQETDRLRDNFLQLLFTCLHMRELLRIEAEVLGTTLEEVLEINHEKLRTRYKERFTAEAALHRDLEAEGVVLAKNCDPAEGQNQS